jgi:hypothetical protein
MTTYLISWFGVLLALYSIALALSTPNLIAAEFFKAMALLIGMGVVMFMHKAGIKDRQ